MFPHFLAQKFNQTGVHEFVVVGNEQADARFRGHFFWKFLPQPFLMPLFHHDNHVRPAELAGGNFDARASSVPAERTSHAGSFLKMVSAVRLRRRLRLQTNKILVRSLAASKISSVINQTWFLLLFEVINIAYIS